MNRTPTNKELSERVSELEQTVEMLKNKMLRLFGTWDEQADYLNGTLKVAHKNKTA